jgi:hypothetical protein
MKYIIILVIGTFLLISCESIIEESDTQLHEKSLKKYIVEYINDTLSPAYGAIQLNGTALDTLLGDIDTVINVEFMDLHSYADSVPLDDTLIVDDYLEKNGFMLATWGRGNWIMGPRIITYVYKNRQCECQLSKLYYSNYNGIALNDSLKVTEWLKCQRISKDSTELAIEQLINALQ